MDWTIEQNPNSLLIINQPTLCNLSSNWWAYTLRFPFRSIFPNRNNQSIVDNLFWFQSIVGQSNSKLLITSLLSPCNLIDGIPSNLWPENLSTADQCKMINNFPSWPIDCLIKSNLNWIQINQKGSYTSSINLIKSHRCAQGACRVCLGTPYIPADISPKLPQQGS